jgi:hypothetical protein
MIRVDMGELEQVPRRTDPQEDDWLVPTRPSCFPEHRPTLNALYSCQFVLRGYRAFSFTGLFPYHIPQRSPASSHSLKTGLGLPLVPLTSSLVYCPRLYPPSLVSSYLS